MTQESFYHYLNIFFEENDIDRNLRQKIAFVPFANYENRIFSKVDFLVFEDRWIAKPEIIKSKLSDIYTKNIRIFARKCSVEKIPKHTATDFLNINHIYGDASAKHRLALWHEGEAIAVATFAGTRQFKTGKSAELLRFSSKNNITVVGGLSKLLKAYIKRYAPDDIMTYIDADWGAGNAFLKLGFTEKEAKPPMLFYCNRQTGQRIPEKYFTDFENLQNYAKYTNSGSKKLVLRVN